MKKKIIGGVFLLVCGGVVATLPIFRRMLKAPSLVGLNEGQLQESADLAIKHPYWGDFLLQSSSRLTLRKRTKLSFDTSLQDLDGYNDAQRVLGTQAADETRHVASLLKENSISRMHREGGMLIFFINTSFCASHCPGYVYSLDGTNPNQKGGPCISSSRPFTHLRGRWYSSNVLFSETSRIGF
ncbi:hypothetical protein IAD21_03591 [Abditibacteriota bacterium]|nr:hypothetical protein IAD21_03591 [Abditibacteriota bacterium]